MSEGPHSWRSRVSLKFFILIFYCLCYGLAMLKLRHRLAQYIDVRKAAPCWLWTGSTAGKGYGKLRWRGRVVGAHRASYRAWKGHIPEGLHVCHRCDNPWCVKPEHLFLATNRENMQDALKKGRLMTGERATHAKLTEEDVREMRKRWCRMATVEKLAGHFGVSEGTVHNIVSGRSWRHLPVLPREGPRLTYKKDGKRKLIRRSTIRYIVGTYAPGGRRFRPDGKKSAQELADELGLTQTEVRRVLHYHYRD